MYRARRHNHVRISMAHARYPGSYGVTSVMLLVHRVPSSESIDSWIPYTRVGMNQFGGDISRHRARENVPA